MTDNNRMNTGKIPIVIGVTGHRNLCTEELPVLRGIVRNELDTLKKKCPHSPVIVMSSLAEGADQLCAKVALEEGLGLIVPLPMPEDEFIRDFDEGSKSAYEELKAKADSCFVVPHREPYAEGRDYLYRQADIYVAEHCHILMALWDGSPARPGGCGAAETVDFKLNRSFAMLEGESLRPASAFVCHIMTNRADSEIKEELVANLIGDRESFEEILKKTDRFNRQVPELPSNEEGNEPGVYGRIKSVYEAADSISVRAQKGTNIGIALIAILATLITTAFLLYDEAELHWMIIACIASIIGLFLLNGFFRRTGAHIKYTQARLLAEELRVQEFCIDAGIRHDAADLLPWAVWTDVPWVAMAVKTLTTGDKKSAAPSRAARFVEDQKAYHERAIVKTCSRQKKNEKIMTVALALTLMSYAAGFIFEILCGGLFGDVIVRISDPEMYRTALKLVMGILSAATLFAGSYYGKLSVDEEAEGHRRMRALCEVAAGRMNGTAPDEFTAEGLAREMLGENADWYDYRSRNKPEISL